MFREVPSLMLCQGGKHNHRSITNPGSNPKKRCSHIVTEITMHTTQNSPIQSEYNLQTWTGTVHSRLAVKTKPQRKNDYKIPGMKINAIDTATA